MQPWKFIEPPVSVIKGQEGSKETLVLLFGLLVNWHLFYLFIKAVCHNWYIVILKMG